MGERRGDRAIVSDEPLIDVGEPQETLQGLAFSGFGPLLYRPDLLWVHTDVPSWDDVSQEGGRGAGEFTLLSFDEQLILQKTA